MRNYVSRGARRRRGLRRQSGRHPHPVPSGDPRRRFARRLSLGREAQGAPARTANEPRRSTWRILDAIRAGLDERGFHVLPGLLDPRSCEQLAAGYAADQFRSTIVMARHGFGRGEYKYYRYPLPPLIVGRFAPRSTSGSCAIANDWQRGARLARPLSRPSRQSSSRAAGRRASRRPTPLILRYGPGDYNCLHQDVYGEHCLPAAGRGAAVEPGRISRAASSCSPSSGRAVSRAPRSCRSDRATP